MLTVCGAFGSCKRSIILQAIRCGLWVYFLIYIKGFIFALTMYNVACSDTACAVAGKHT